MADFRNKLFSFACLSSQRARAATPFLISKQPYFSSFFHVAASLFLRRVHLRRVSDSHYSRASPIYHPPTYFSGTQRFPSPSFAPTSLSLARSFRQRSPFLARSSRAVLRVPRTCVALILLPRHFQPRVSFPLHGPRFSFSHPLQPLHIIFLGNRLIHSPTLSAKDTAHRGTRAIDNKYKATIQSRYGLTEEIHVELCFRLCFDKPLSSSAAKSSLFMFPLSQFTSVHAL